MRPADYAMGEAADKKKRRKRKYHVPAEFTGKDLVMAELKWTLFLGPGVKLENGRSV
jgi:hypothetical protein